MQKTKQTEPVTANEGACSIQAEAVILLFTCSISLPPVFFFPPFIDKLDQWRQNGKNAYNQQYRSKVFFDKGNAGKVVAKKQEDADPGNATNNVVKSKMPVTHFSYSGW